MILADAGLGVPRFDIFVRGGEPGHGAIAAVARWLGREDSNLRMTEPKSVALPLGDAPFGCP
jgi:hypothetical protein